MVNIMPPCIAIFISSKNDLSANPSLFLNKNTPAEIDESNKNKFINADISYPNTDCPVKKKINEITSAQLASIQQENKSILSFLIAGTVIAAAAALLNIALKWAQKSRQARSINDLEEEEAVDGFEDEFEDESNEQLRDVIVGEGVEIVETHCRNSRRG